MVYPPSEDTYLTLELLKDVDYNDLCIEIGSGSCIISTYLSTKCRHVVAVDIDLNACKSCPPDIDVLCSDAAEAVARGDLVVSNPPYLPPETPLDSTHHDVGAVPKILRWITTHRPRVVVLTFSSLGRADLILDTLRTMCRIVDVGVYHLFFENIYTVRALC
ncbi:MAG: class I SAM-dependent methyltransferase [Pyrobaculum sp.]